ncbi:helix-turn-helix domain-containing protein [Quadrisphaera oryzae]|uniref:helix-turn-helix domain-containing protein n=1 Tax=Quadrisphaera TaxID=317661 RepID=UPI0016492E7A|nr:helix-turn-helix domain-containing protein [Quadrisphaera sp. RL12-1S]
MQQLALRLSALDPEAGAALRVVTYFDELAAGGAGLTAVVRGAALLTGSPALLVDPRRRLRVRVEVDGSATSPPGASLVGASPATASPDPGWLRAPVDVVAGGGGDGGAVLWLERPGPARVVDAVVLERAAALLHALLARTRPLHDTAPEPDEAAVEVLLDDRADPVARDRAARSLGLGSTSRHRVVAAEGAPPRLVSSAAWGADLPPVGRVGRVGVGPAAAPDQLPGSWQDAQRALRLAADGTADDPGPRVVLAEEVPALLLLADAVGPTTPRSADVVALDRAAAAAPWALTTLDALARSASRRTAATALGLHHSTLTERVHALERHLGWPLDDPAGLLRLSLALVVRRLHRHPPTVGG